MYRKYLYVFGCNKSSENVAQNVSFLIFVLLLSYHIFSKFDCKSKISMLSIFIIMYDSIWDSKKGLHFSIQTLFTDYKKKMMRYLPRMILEKNFEPKVLYMLSGQNNIVQIEAVRHIFRLSYVIPYQQVVVMFYLSSFLLKFILRNYFLMSQTL